jgi:GH35 family endo-1,4-beta-xylanase
MNKLLFFLCLLPLLVVAQDDEGGLTEFELDRRIDALRKGDFVVTLKDSEGQPVRGTVRYSLARHEFPFGTCVAAGPLLANPRMDWNARCYQKILKNWFNCAVAENAHKWYCMEKEEGQPSDEEALQVYEKCRKLGLPMRGHCVFWGIRHYVQPWIRALGPIELEAAMRSRLKRVLTVFRGKITEWDLNNEMMHSDYYADRLGWKNGVKYFEWAREAVPENTYCVNEYHVLTGDDIDRYVAHIRELRREGARVGGINDQAHFYGRVPSNAHLWRILDRLGQFDLPVKITEFDITPRHNRACDRRWQAEDTRRFYKLCFAHPAVRGILMWGFWEGTHWIPRAALWNTDWTIRPNGQAYIDLMREWRTSGEETPDSKGRIRFRGFFGDYDLSVGKRAVRVTLSREQRKAEATLQ